MDVHPTKNGINRYWSIPIFGYMFRSSMTQNPREIGSLSVACSSGSDFSSAWNSWRRGRGRPSPPWHVEQRSAIYRENNGWNHGFYMFLPRNRGVQWILVNYSTSFRTCQNVDEEGTSEINCLMLQKICTNLFHHIMGTSNKIQACWNQHPHV